MVNLHLMMCAVNRLTLFITHSEVTMMATLTGDPITLPLAHTHGIIIHMAIINMLILWLQHSD